MAVTTAREKAEEDEDGEGRRSPPAGGQGWEREAVGGATATLNAERARVSSHATAHRPPPTGITFHFEKACPASHVQERLTHFLNPPFKCTVPKWCSAQMSAAPPKGPESEAPKSEHPPKSFKTEGLPSQRAPWGWGLGRRQGVGGPLGGHNSPIAQMTPPRAAGAEQGGGEGGPAAVAALHSRQACTSLQFVCTGPQEHSHFTPVCARYPEKR